MGRAAADRPGAGLHGHMGALAKPMKELLRTNDIVRLSWIQALLGGAGIDCVVLDGHTSMVEGSIGAIQRRVMVEDAAVEEARQLLRAAEEARDG
jgi:hypothetical protein